MKVNKLNRIIEKKRKKIEINKNNLLNWSILINRGKENKNDFHSNGEWNGKMLNLLINLFLTNNKKGCCKINKKLNQEINIYKLKEIIWKDIE